MKVPTADPLFPIDKTSYIHKYIKNVCINDVQLLIRYYFGVFVLPI